MIVRSCCGDRRDASRGTFGQYRADAFVVHGLAGWPNYAATTALEALHAAGGEHTRAILLLETGEESGSPDLPAYLDHLSGRLGDVSLVLCLDSGGFDRERLWLTSSLRGMLHVTVTVRVLETSVHSGMASGVVPSPFRVMRLLLDRVEDAATGAVTVPEMNVPIPAVRHAEAEAVTALDPRGMAARFPLTEGMRAASADDTELLLNNTWRPTLSVIGAAGLPDPATAGAVLHDATSLRLSFRLPPTVDAEVARAALVRTLTTDVPHGARVEVGDVMAANGWHAPPPEPWLESTLGEVADGVFGAPSRSVGLGGGIPFMELLGRTYPHERPEKSIRKPRPEHAWRRREESLRGWRTSPSQAGVPRRSPANDSVRRGDLLAMNFGLEKAASTDMDSRYPHSVGWGGSNDREGPDNSCDERIHDAQHCHSRMTPGCRAGMPPWRGPWTPP